MILHKQVVDFVRWSVLHQPTWHFPNYIHACELIGDKELHDRAVALHAQYFHLAKAMEVLGRDISYRLDHQKGTEDDTVWINVEKPGAKA